MNCYKPKTITLFLTLTLVSLGLNWHGLSIAHPVKDSLSTQSKQLPPAPPSTPPPNRTRSGGSLGGETACVTGDQNLIALVPVQNPVLTTVDHPTFLFYVPYGADQVQYGEFSLLVGPDEMTRLYQARFTLPDQPGVVSVSLPKLPDYALKENTSYHWYFKLYCNGSTTADVQVDGWVQRVAATPDRQRQIEIASPQVWYDSLAEIATGLLAEPNNNLLRAQWRILLEHIDSGNLTQAPLVGAVQLETEQSNVNQAPE
jgi:hypothetical protein